MGKVTYNISNETVGHRSTDTNARRKPHGPLCTHPDKTPTTYSANYFTQLKTAKGLSPDARVLLLPNVKR